VNVKEIHVHTGGRRYPGRRMENSIHHNKKLKTQQDSLILVTKRIGQNTDEEQKGERKRKKNEMEMKVGVWKPTE